MRQQTFMDMGWDPREFGRRLDRRYVIQDRETGRFRPFGELLRDNEPQQEFYRTVIGELMRGGPVRIIVLKSRKPGISTATGTLFYDLTTTIEGMGAGVLAHQAEATTVLFDMVKRLWSRTEADLRPKVAKRNGTEWFFGAKTMLDMASGDAGLQSAYSCATAGGEFPFSGSTQRCVHFSEIGKFPGDFKKQNDLIMSVLNSVPVNGPSLVIAESTANGKGNWFERTWWEAWDNRHKRTPGQWIPIFISWADDRQNRIPVPAHFDWENWPMQDRIYEREILQAQHGCDEEQLLFRRFKIREISGAALDPDVFHQDFPLTPRDAFLSAGRPAIPRRLMDAQERHVIKKPDRFRCELLRALGEGTTLNRTPDPGGDLVVFEEPQPGAEYILGCDPSLGRSSADHVDHSAVTIWKRTGVRQLEQVAEWVSRWSIGRVGEVIAILGREYNDAIINVEKNLSDAILHALLREGYPAGQLYVPVRFRAKQPSESTEYFLTKHASNQHLLTDILIDYLDLEHIKIRSAETLDQLRGLEKDDKGTVLTRGQDRAVAVMMSTIADADLPPPGELVDRAQKVAPACPRGVDPDAWAEMHSAVEEQKPVLRAAGWKRTAL